MSYLGYTSLMLQYCRMFKHPRVLEIGVDKGQTALPLIHNLVTLGRPFKWVGIDVLPNTQLYEQLLQMAGPRVVIGNEECQKVSKDPQTMDPNDPSWNVSYTIANSLDTLPNLIKNKWKFDLVLIDGDHNYMTVIKELGSLKALTHDVSLTIVDDYSSKWKDRDLYYKDRDTHSKCARLSRPEPVEGKAGVNQAVDDWISSNPEYTCEVGLDCAVIVRDHVYLNWTVPPEGLYKTKMSFWVPPDKTDCLSSSVAELLKTVPVPPQTSGDNDTLADAIDRVTIENRGENTAHELTYTHGNIGR